MSSGVHVGVILIKVPAHLVPCTEATVRSVLGKAVLCELIRDELGEPRELFFRLP